MADIEKVIVKARYWWFVLYPESAREDWRDWLQSTGLPFAISPLHDKDKNPDGTDKKPHHHIIIAFNGPTTKHWKILYLKMISKNFFRLYVF